jgi:Fe-S oxidoreductase
LRPDDEDAKRLSQQTFHLAEFLQQEGYTPPPLARKVVLHEHCHQRATGGIDADRKLLEAMGAEVEVPESGCCGLAGAWGYERGHHDVSMACGERVLLPKVRQASAETLVVTAGFSCRSQIEQATNRRALHLAQVIQLAHDRELAPKPQAPSSARRKTFAAVAGAGAVAALAFAGRRRS